MAAAPIAFQSNRYIPQPDERTLRNKLWLATFTGIALGGIALAASAFVNDSSSLAFRSVKICVGSLILRYSNKMVIHLYKMNTTKADQLYDDVSSGRLILVKKALFFGANPNFCSSVQSSMTVLHPK